MMRPADRGTSERMRLLQAAVRNRAVSCLLPTGWAESPNLRSVAFATWTSPARTVASLLQPQDSATESSVLRTQCTVYGGM